MTTFLQHNPSTGSTTSRSCRGSWLRIQTQSSALSRQIPFTGGRQASRVAMETRHLSCWSLCLNVEVGFYLELNVYWNCIITERKALFAHFAMLFALPIVATAIIRLVTLPDGSIAGWSAPHLLGHVAYPTSPYLSYPNIRTPLRQ